MSKVRAKFEACTANIKKLLCSCACLSKRTAHKATLLPQEDQELAAISAAEQSLFGVGQLEDIDAVHDHGAAHASTTGHDEENPTYTPLTKDDVILPDTSLSPDTSPKRHKKVGEIFGIETDVLTPPAKRP